MKRFTILLLLSMVCTIAGCGGKYYYQEGKSFSECERDRADCLTELNKRADYEMPGAYERTFMEECMKGKGYRLVKEKELPIDVKRQDPPSTVVGRAYGSRNGIAGTIE